MGYLQVLVGQNEVCQKWQNLYSTIQYWRQKKPQKSASMYEWLAIPFRVAVVSQDISRQNCQESPGCPPLQDSPSVSSTEVEM